MSSRPRSPPARGGFFSFRPVFPPASSPGGSHLRATHADARRLLAARILERQVCLADPIRLMSHMTGVDQRTGERFDFAHLREPLEPGEITFDPVYETSLRPRDATWRWQRYLADRLEDQIRLIFLKGRQIGVTWIVLGYDVAEAIVKPGTTSLLFRQGEADAIDNVRRWYTLYQSLPAYLREGIKVIRPDRGVMPGRDGVALQFASGEISDVIPMSSAKASGHGRSVRHVNADGGRLHRPARTDHGRRRASRRQRPHHHRQHRQRPLERGDRGGQRVPSPLD